MKLKFTFIIFAAILAVGFLVSRSPANAANCTLVGGVWINQSAAVGEKVQFQLRGNNCNGWTASLNIYEQDPGPDDYIRTLPLVFKNDTNATITIQFTPEDYTKGGNESSNEMVYIAAVVGEGSTKSEINNENSPITLNKPTGSGGGCQLAGASWSTKFSAQPIVGSPLHMVVTGVGCPNYKVSYEIYDYTAVSNDARVGHVEGQFNAAGTTADTVWKAQGKDIATGEDRKFGNYQFYFIAAVGSNTAESSKYPVTVNSQAGCINCNNVGGNLPGTQMCADGFSGSGSGNTVCQSHIGDALTDSAGTCTTCSPGGGAGTGGSTGNGTGTGTGVVPGTANKTYSFNITNPLKGGPNDLFDIINIVTQWIMYIAIPLAVLWIMYAGFLMLTAGPTPANFQKGRDILKYTILGLAIIFIGKGFVSLIISVIELGGTSPTTQNQSVEPTGDCVNNACTNTGGYCITSADCSNVVGIGSVGHVCQQDNNCQSGLKCKNTLCERPKGNNLGEACFGGQDCVAGLACDTTQEATQIISGRDVGTCFMPDQGPQQP